MFAKVLLYSTFLKKNIMTSVAVSSDKSMTFHIYALRWGSSTSFWYSFYTTKLNA